MATRISRALVDTMADIVSDSLGLTTPRAEGSVPTALCKSCERSGVDLSTSFYKGCRVYVQGAYGGYSVRLRHADTGESEMGLGYVTLRECHTFLKGMRAALQVQTGAARQGGTTDVL